MKTNKRTHREPFASNRTAPDQLSPAIPFQDGMRPGAKFHMHQFAQTSADRGDGKRKSEQPR